MLQKPHNFQLRPASFRIHKLRMFLELELTGVDKMLSATVADKQGDTAVIATKGDIVWVFICHASACNPNKLLGKKLIFVIMGGFKTFLIQRYENRSIPCLIAGAISPDSSISAAGYSRCQSTHRLHADYSGDGGLEEVALCDCSSPPPQI